MNDFASQLKQLRTKSGWTQAQLADRVGVSPHAISNYERGIRFPTYKTLVMFASVFDVDLDYLINHTTANIGSLSREETEIIYAFRKLSITEKNMICRSLNIDYNNYTKV